MDRASSSLGNVKKLLEKQWREEERKGRTLCGESTTSDAVSNFFETGVHVEHFGWNGLKSVRWQDEIQKRELTLE